MVFERGLGVVEEFDKGKTFTSVMNHQFNGVENPSPTIGLLGLVPRHVTKQR